MKDFKVNILGTEYDVRFRHPNEDEYLKKVDGYLDRSIKKIVISEKDESCELADFDYYQRSICRHEIIHAFMEESGLSTNVEHKLIGIEETMVDWMAIQFPKIAKIFVEHKLL